MDCLAARVAIPKRYYDALSSKGCEEWAYYEIESAIVSWLKARDPEWIPVEDRRAAMSNEKPMLELVFNCIGRRTSTYYGNQKVTLVVHGNAEDMQRLREVQEWVFNHCRTRIETDYGIIPESSVDDAVALVKAVIQDMELEEKAGVRQAGDIEHEELKGRLIAIKFRELAEKVRSTRHAATQHRYPKRGLLTKDAFSLCAKSSRMVMVLNAQLLLGDNGFYNLMRAVSLCKSGDGWINYDGVLTDNELLFNEIVYLKRAITRLTEYCLEADARVVGDVYREAMIGVMANVLSLGEKVGAPGLFLPHPSGKWYDITSAYLALKAAALMAMEKYISLVRHKRKKNELHKQAIEALDGLVSDIECCANEVEAYYTKYSSRKSEKGAQHHADAE